MLKKIWALLPFLFLFNLQLFAWGNNGHRVIGLIAEKHLNEKAKIKLNELLKGNSLAEVSTWMDDIRSDSAFDYTHDWHWVSIPDSINYEESVKNPAGDIIAKIEELIKNLKEQKFLLEEHQKNIKFLVHLIGDLHQPLHVGNGKDSGGNDVKLEWFHRKSNLHRVWDSDMIEDKGLSFTELAGFIDIPERGVIQAWQTSSVREWANESKSYRQRVYDIPENKKIGYEYSYKNFELVELRLLQAGIRLAGVLNEIYGG